MKLTIGMSCYDDYDGVWFTIQSIKMFHPECIDDINFVVVDGNPGSRHGQAWLAVYWLRSDPHLFPPESQP